LVQTVFPLSENTGLALTTAKYYTPSGRLIQRDYTGVSLYDYYYNHDDNGTATAANREVKMTDSGRPVYGGGGISPDVRFETPKQNHFQDELLQHYAFFNFAKHYTINHQVTKNFTVDDAVMQDFRKFLDDQKVAFTESDMASANDWIHNNIKSEIFIDSFGQEEGLKVRADGDPLVVKALDLMGQAKTLADNAKKIVAERNSARATAMANQNR
jgi:carboxyl-terminal processing protease